MLRYSHVVLDEGVIACQSVMDVRDTNTVVYVQAMLRYSHVVLDEVHERSMDMDLLNLLIKKLMALQGQAKTKLVVMSATLQSGLFGEYFTPPPQAVQPHIFVGARRFPVQAIYLEQLLQAVPALRSTCGSSVSKAVNAFESAAKAQAQGGKVCMYVCMYVCM